MCRDVTYGLAVIEPVNVSHTAKRDELMTKTTGFGVELDNTVSIRIYSRAGYDTLDIGVSVGHRDRCGTLILWKRDGLGKHRSSHAPFKGLASFPSSAHIMSPSP